MKLKRINNENRNKNKKEGAKVGYRFNSENFEKIVYDNIKQDKKQMEFLRARGSQELIEHKETKDAVYHLGEFIYEWYCDIRGSIHISSVDEQLTRENTGIFYDLLDEIFELVSFEDLAQEIIYDIKEEMYVERKFNSP